MNGLHGKLKRLNKKHTTLKKNIFKNSKKIATQLLDDEINLINSDISDMGFFKRLKFVFKGIEF